MGFLRESEITIGALVAEKGSQLRRTTTSTHANTHATARNSNTNTTFPFGMRMLAPRHCRLRVTQRSWLRFSKLHGHLRRIHQCRYPPSSFREGLIEQAESSLVASGLFTSLLNGGVVYS